MTYITDWSDLGIFPLQDHDPDVELDMRSMVVGGRFGGLDEDGDQKGVLEDGRGTVGDIHPWRYWPPLDRGARPMGSWAQAFACVVTGKNQGPVTPPRGERRDPVYTAPADSVPPGTRNPYLGQEGGPGGQNSASALPIRRDDYKADRRYKVLTHKLPPGMSEPPKGAVAIALAGTEEREEERLLLPLEGSLRLIAVNWSPPGHMGTQVFDLEPDGVIAPNRGARLQSTMRVIRMMGPMPGLANADENGLAWQLTTSQQDSLAGYGMAYGKLDSSVPGFEGPKDDKPKGPVSGTPNPNVGQGGQNMSNPTSGAFGGSGGVNPGNVPGTREGVWETQTHEQSSGVGMG